MNRFVFLITGLSRFLFQRLSVSCWNHLTRAHYTHLQNTGYNFDTYLEFSMSQHGRLGEAVPTLHQVNHIQHGQEGQWDVHVTTRTRTFQMLDVIGRRGAVSRYGGGAQNGYATESAPGQRGKTAVHEEGQEEALPVGLPTKGRGQRLLDWPLLWRHREEKNS